MRLIWKTTTYKKFLVWFKNSLPTSNIVYFGDCWYHSFGSVLKSV